jgi:fucose permease
MGDRKIDLRIIPGMFISSYSSSLFCLWNFILLIWKNSNISTAFWILYFLCSAIRSNVGLAQTMNSSSGHDLEQVLHLTAKQTSTALALFYVAYVVFDFPSNLIMTRLSPRVWMSRIVLAVGIIGACFAAVKAAWSLL